MLLLTEGNVPLDQSLRLSADSTSDRRLRDAARRVADRIQRGEPAWSTNANSRDQAGREFPLLIRLALYHSTNRSLLTGGLRQAATLYRERAVRVAEWYAEYVPILLTVGVAGTLTMGFTLAVLWPYASALHELAHWNWR
jgi:type II secretory pathway component PulF